MTNSFLITKIIWIIYELFVLGDSNIPLVFMLSKPILPYTQKYCSIMAY